MSAFITSIGTALPPFKARQENLLHFMIGRLRLNKKESHELEVLYRASGIRYRYSVVPDFTDPASGHLFINHPTVNGSPGVEERLKIYRTEALKLAANATNNCLVASNISKNEITHLITVSCTGMDAPGIDIQLIEKLGLSSEVERTAINFMGCYGCFNAFKLASHIAGHQPDACILIVSVELCSLHLQDLTAPDNLLSNSLFGDGSGAVLVQSQPQGKSLEMKAFHSDLSLKAKKEMDWRIGNHGFLMTLTANIPEVIKTEISGFTAKLLEKAGFSFPDIHSLAMHPGGRSILKVIEETLGFSADQNCAAHEVLRSFGNMSSATILFVLQHCMENVTKDDHGRNILSMAFGPGLAIEGGIFTNHTDTC